MEKQLFLALYLNILYGISQALINSSVHVAVSHMTAIDFGCMYTEEMFVLVCSVAVGATYC